MVSFVICSSMKNLAEMIHLRNVLQSKGHQVEMPTEFDTHQFPFGLELQKVARPAHLLKIHNLKEGDIVLVVNPTGKIGGGTFTEISYAYALNTLHGQRLRIITTEPILPETFGFEELSVFGIELLNPSEFGLEKTINDTKKHKNI